MAGRRTNLAILGAFTAAFFTGLVAFGVGSGWSAWATASHAITAFAVVLLTPWKSVIARRGLKRHRSGATASLVLSIAIAVAIVAGILHSTGAARSLGFATAMQVHVGAALASVPLAAWHVIARPQRLRRTDLTRRRLVKAGALIAGGGAVYGAMEAAAVLLRAPGAARRSTGSYEIGSFEPERMPVTQWLDDRVLEVDVGAWRLIVTGRTWSYDELSLFDDRVRATLDCTGGWYAHQEWSGVWLDRLLDADDKALSIAVTSLTGYARRFPIDDASRLLLATRVAGSPLRAGHGAPARIVAPGRRGFWWVKWVDRIELSARPWWVQFPFPVT